jgi:D-glycero-beta-D-manno-heptose-7-phosphate kinase
VRESSELHSAIMSKTPTQTDRLRKIIGAFPRVTVTVLGDMVADEFVFGEISRVSREAPVLILRHRERTVLPGGGANAVNNLAELGVNVLPVGIVGNDDPGRLLLRSFRHKRIPVTGILKDKSYTTVTKTRIIAGMPHTWRQQVVRIDREPEMKLNSHLARELALATQQYLRASDALLVSDYGYGAATPEIVNASRGLPASLLLPKWKNLSSVPIVLDSRHRMLEFSGITAATPNEPEVEEALGIKIGQDWGALCSAGAEVINRMNLKSLIITRGRDGMVAFSEKHKPSDIPIFGTDEVADVTGAGDTVIATFTAAIAAGATAEEAAHLANYAGGIVVMKRGTATICPQELIAALEKAPPQTRSH